MKKKKFLIPCGLGKRKFLNQVSFYKQRQTYRTKKYMIWGKKQKTKTEKEKEIN